jgi:hypothetical protein
MSVPRAVRARKAKPRGVVLYRGPSLLNGKKIAVVATGLASKSKNPKTGDMVQVYILADGQTDPVLAAQTGKDEAICGDCPHRGSDGKLGSCYVNLIQGPLSVWRALKRGTYPRFSAKDHLRWFVGRFVRLGAYGDPAAVPVDVWRQILAVSAGWTGYTHQWRTCSFAYAHLTMASVETPADYHLARSLGWRTFRVRLESQELLPGEFICPASNEAEYRLTCERCRACRGITDSPQAASPVIIVHGPTTVPWKQKRYEETMERLLEQENGKMHLTVLA